MREGRRELTVNSCQLSVMGGGEIKSQKSKVKAKAERLKVEEKGRG